MRVLLRIVLGSLSLAIVLAVLVLVGARFADGPLAIVAGGPFRTGEPQRGAEPDWSFVRDIPTIEFQLLEPPRSRTTWIVTTGGRAFIPCGYMNSSWGRIWKKWPIEAERDGRAIARIDGKLYERSLVRIREGDVLEPVLAELSRKYVGRPVPREAVTSGALWIFELGPRR